MLSVPMPFSWCSPIETRSKSSKNDAARLDTAIWSPLATSITRDAQLSVRP